MVSPEDARRKRPYLCSWLLRPTAPLGHQLLLAFGLPATIIIVGVTLVASLLASNSVDLHPVITSQVVTSFATSSLYVAEQISAYMDLQEGTVQLAVQLAQDRLSSRIPFDEYPLHQPPPPLVSDFVSNYPNLTEALPGRPGIMYRLVEASPISTEQGVYHTQCLYWMETGVCDWNRTIQDDMYYDKMGDLVPPLKALYEATEDAFTAGIYLYNEGKGSLLWYPGHNMANATYTSLGCNDDGELCGLAGQERYAPTQYTPLERHWFQTCFASNQTIYYGPHRGLGTDALSVTLVCSKFYDLTTGQPLGVVAMAVHFDSVRQRLLQSRLMDNTTDLAIAGIHSGDLFLDTVDRTEYYENVPIYDTDFMSQDEWNHFANVIDFDQEYTREQVLQAFADATLERESGGLLTAYPIPLPPTQYDPTYRPISLLLHKSPPDKLQEALQAVQGERQQILRQMLSIVWSLALVGCLCVWGIVRVVARILEQPLHWIERVAYRMVHAKDASDDDASSAVLEEPRLLIQTEISELVTIFRSMTTSGFSGQGAATVADPPQFEIRNEMTWRSDFQDLYAVSHRPFKGSVIWQSMRHLESDLSDTQSGPLQNNSTGNEVMISGMDSLPTSLVERPSPRMVHNVSDASNNPASQHPPDLPAAPTVFPAPPMKNMDRNIADKKAARSSLPRDEEGITKSSLFWWILLLIALPLVVTNAGIGMLIFFNVVTKNENLVERVEQISIDLELESLRTSVFLKAETASLAMDEVLRDLHLHSRMAQWLFFGAIQRSDGFTKMVTLAEECKSIEAGDPCPYLDEMGVSPCTCDLIFAPQDSCTAVEENGRYHQLNMYAVSALNADNNGNRNNSAYPDAAFDPESTLWWNGVDALPGSWKQQNASGYETAYDRIRVASAMAIVGIPIANYAGPLRRDHHFVGAHIGFENDGGITGYSGCALGYTFFAQWESNDENKAYELNPQLCPRGKYGYDTRCRDWYVTGKEDFFDDGIQVHVTAPYQFASTSAGASVTAPITNPATGEYVGQALFDYTPGAIRDTLKEVKESMSFMITVEGDALGHDTVIGPNRNDDGWKPQRIIDVMFPGAAETDEAQYFNDKIIAKMKAGESGENSFTDRQGGIHHVSYSPVEVKYLNTLDAADFARGVSRSTAVLYSVLLGATVQELSEPFRAEEESFLAKATQTRRLFVLIVFAVTLLFMAYVFFVTVAIVYPMMSLLSMVRNIKDGSGEKGLPALKGGSREIHQVHKSFSKLNKVVRMSNIAYFSGNLVLALEFVTDALKLYRKVEDRKAIGIACNNYGNTLYAMARAAVQSGDTKTTQADYVSLYKSAIEHYNESVNIGQEEFDEAENESLKADYAIQLSDRLFNRALFNLLAFASSIAPEGSREDALTDLERVHHLDYDVKEFWLDRRLLLQNSDKCYARLLRRIHGLIDCYEDEDVQRIWDLKELIEEADQLLFAAWSEKKAPIFSSLSRVGRLQQLEAVAMHIDLLEDRTSEAGRLAMRLYTEDEFLLESAVGSASRTLMVLMFGDSPNDWSLETKLSCRQDLRKMQRSCRNSYCDLGKCVILCFEINEDFEADPILDRIHDCCMRLYDFQVQSDDYFGVVAYTINGPLHVEMALKEENEGRQRGGIEMATTTTNDRCSPALPFAAQMIVDSSASLETDSFIVLVADGHSFDPASFQAARTQLERLNRERSSTIHIFVLALSTEVPSEIALYKDLRSLTKLSSFMEINESNIDVVFAAIGNIIRGQNLANSGHQFLSMEKF